MTGTVKDGASLASLAELVYAGRPPRHVWWKGLVNDKRWWPSAARLLDAATAMALLTPDGTWVWLPQAVSVPSLRSARLKNSPAAIATARGLVPNPVYRLLRALSTLGLVTEPTRGRFALTPLGRLLSSHSPHNTRTTAIFLNDYFAEMWTHLDDALAGERTAFEVLKGAPFFDWLAQHPHEARRFDRMMLEVHGPETPAIVAAYDFSPFEHVVDIGGGNGSLLSAVLAAYPKLRATLFDMEEAIAAAKRGEGGLLPGVNFASGDVFATAAPAGGDVYLIRHLLHDYEDRDCVRILAKVRAAMQPQGRVLVLEAPLPSDESPGPGRWLDLQVMLLCGGRERTVEEYAGLFEQAGLRLARTMPTQHPAMTVIEAVTAGNPRG